MAFTRTLSCASVPPSAHQGAPTRHYPDDRGYGKTTVSGSSTHGSKAQGTQCHNVLSGTLSEELVRAACNNRRRPRCARSHYGRSASSARIGRHRIPLVTSTVGVPRELVLDGQTGMSLRATRLPRASPRPPTGARLSGRPPRGVRSLARDRLKATSSTGTPRRPKPRSLYWPPSAVT